LSSTAKEQQRSITDYAIKTREIQRLHLDKEIAVFFIFIIQPSMEHKMRNLTEIIEQLLPEYESLHLNFQVQ